MDQLRADYIAACRKMDAIRLAKSRGRCEAKIHALFTIPGGLDDNSDPRLIAAACEYIAAVAREL